MHLLNNVSYKRSYQSNYRLPASFLYAYLVSLIVKYDCDARSIMWRLFIERPLAGIAQRADVLGQFGHHGFELVDATALLIDRAVEVVDEVFLVGQLDFDVDETVLVAHVDVR